MNLECSISNLSLKVRCDTINLCRCTVFLKAMRSFESDVYYSFAKSRGGPDRSGGRSISVSYIHKCVDVLLVRLIL